jgi:hypothetical protein
MMTTIVNELGERFQIDLSEWPFFPNYDHNFTFSLLAKKDEPIQPTILNVSFYSTTPFYKKNPKNHIFPKADVIHNCPIVISATGMFNRKKPGPGDIITKGNAKFRLWYSSIKCEGMFGFPRVIVSGERYPHAFLDYESIYGIGTHGIIIPVSSKEEGELFVKSIESKKFQKWTQSIKWQTNQTKYKMFKYFRFHWYDFFLN